MKKMICILIFIFCLSLSSCGLSHIEDSNGEEDFSLSTLKNEEILTYNSVVSYGTVESTTNSTFSYSCKKLSGNCLVKTITPKGRELLVTISNNVFSGNAYIALVRNGNVFKEIPLNQIINLEIRGFDHYQLRILAESCHISVRVAIEEKL